MGKVTEGMCINVVIILVSVCAMSLVYKIRGVGMGIG